MFVFDLQESKFKLFFNSKIVTVDGIENLRTNMQCQAVSAFNLQETKLKTKNKKKFEKHF